MTYEIVSFKANWLKPQITRQQVEDLESLIKEVESEVCTMKHHFAPGLYAREMFMPKGTVLTGAVHKTEHLVIVYGDVSVTIDSSTNRLTGHNTFVSKAGAKRAMFAHEDTWVTGLFVTDKTDVAEIENDVVENPDNLQYRRFHARDLEIESCS